MADLNEETAKNWHFLPKTAVYKRGAQDYNNYINSQFNKWLNPQGNLRSGGTNF